MLTIVRHFMSKGVLTKSIEAQRGHYDRYFVVDHGLEGGARGSRVSYNQ